MTFLRDLDNVLRKSLTPARRPRTGGWNPIIHEPWTGAWQHNAELTSEQQSGYPAVFACITLIAGDVARLGLGLRERDKDGIWHDVDHPAYSPVLHSPNGWQTPNQFWEHYMLCLLQNGNVYVLLARDQRGLVTQMFVLDPSRVSPLIADDGSVFYELQPDNLGKVTETVTVPARDVLHDRTHCLWHPLVGVSPIWAAAATVGHGTAIQSANASFFNNAGRPSGVLTAPGAVSDETVVQLKEHWDASYSGINAGKVAILADGLKYEPWKTPSAADSLVVEQLKWTADVVCSVFHVPQYKLGGTLPPNSGIDALNVEYLNQAIAVRLESAESLLDRALRLPSRLRTEFDTSSLLRMTPLAQMEVLDKGRNVMTPNEARKALNLPKKPGGDAVFRQQQDFSIEALAKRDARDDPFSEDGGSTEELVRLFGVQGKIEGIRNHA